MERFELLARLGFAPPEACRMRVIIDTDAKNEGERTLVLRSVSSSRERNTAYLRSGPENRTVRMRRFRYYRVSLFRHMPETVAALGRRTARTYMNP